MIKKSIFSSTLKLATHLEEPAPPHTITNDNTYKSLLYVGSLFEQIKKITNEHIPNLKLSFKSSNPLKNIFSKLKDQIPIQKRTTVVYKIPCLGNSDEGASCQLSYVGQTNYPNFKDATILSTQNNYNKRLTI